MENKEVRLVDADALLETICKKCPELDCKPDATDTVSGCLIYDVIAIAPTIDAQPVKNGKWVKYPSLYRCSNCGYPKGMPKPYCELCGARMEVDEDGTRD